MHLDKAKNIKGLEVIRGTNTQNNIRVLLDHSPTDLTTGVEHREDRM